MEQQEQYDEFGNNVKLVSKRHVLACASCSCLLRQAPAETQALRAVAEATSQTTAMGRTWWQHLCG
jgi:hypothetical protein